MFDEGRVQIAGGHVPYLEHPDRFAQVVSSFAGELERRAGVASEATTP